MRTFLRYISSIEFNSNPLTGVTLSGVLVQPAIAIPTMSKSAAFTLRAIFIIVPLNSVRLYQYI